MKQSQWIGLQLAVEVTGGSTLQYGMRQGLLCLASLVCWCFCTVAE